MLIRSLITLACALTAAASAIPAPIAEHELDERGRHARPPTVRVRPSDPHQCGNVRASWTGVPPFTVEFGLWRGPVKTHGGFLSRFGLYDTQKTSYDWTVIIPKGTPFQVQVTDSTGRLAWYRATVRGGSKKCDLFTTWSVGPLPSTTYIPPGTSPLPPITTVGSAGPPVTTTPSPTEKICYSTPPHKSGESYQVIPTPCASSPLTTVGSAGPPVTTKPSPTEKVCYSTPSHKSGESYQLIPTPCGSPPPTTPPPMSTMAPPRSTTTTSSTSEKKICYSTPPHPSDAQSYQVVPTPCPGE